MSEHIYHDPHLNALDIPIIRPCSTVPPGYSTCIILGAEAASIIQVYRLTKALTPTTKVIFIINTPRRLLKDNPVKSLVDYYPNINPGTFDFTDSAPSELVDVEDFLKSLTKNDTYPIITDTHKLAIKINELYMEKSKKQILFVDDKWFAINDLVKIEFTSGKLSGSLIHGRLCSVSKNKVLIEHNGKYHTISENDALHGKWSPGYSIHISELPRLRLGRFQALLSEASYDIELARYISELRLEPSATSVHWYSEKLSYSEEFQMHPRLAPIVE
ncbi:hypothetical protein V0M98_24670 [Pseudomonas silesiensis]|uniref:hypothetical protein n=1 Tax=Pseudomonas silesiensis TaxID=1853130 RepID=UPI0030CF339D